MTKFLIEKSVIKEAVKLIQFYGFPKFISKIKMLIKRFYCGIAVKFRSATSSKTVKMRDEKT